MWVKGFFLICFYDLIGASKTAKEDFEKSHAPEAMCFIS